MIKLIEEKCGTAKSIPQLILAGASCDDIFVVVLFSAFAAMAQGGRVDAAVFMDIPLSMGMPCGKLILSVAVVAILLTAPVGALGIDRSYKRLLTGAEGNI